MIRAAPASLFVDWHAVEGAVYEVQWFADAALTQLVGNQTVSNSEVEFAGLARGVQYWVRVRAVCNDKSCPASEYLSDAEDGK